MSWICLLKLAWPSAIYEPLNYLKRKNKFYKDISISYDLNSQEISNLSGVSANDETEANSSIAENERFELVDDPLNAHSAVGYENSNQQQESLVIRWNVKCLYP